ncbi:hypothetical protein [Rhodopseudomonas palustris]|uniref:hypothetical protein n=1 Tax=Rhodopseudomonas palustris TaxID=1076 RepID=UPI000CEBED5F|nr:hypothetical protein [Rhodopseudomonas palustris]PPQ42118.1 hypothetical protein CKO39_18180 [Rhodopseudomonas palustris]
MSQDLLAFPPYRPKLPPLDRDGRHAAMLGFWSSNRNLTTEQRLELIKRFGLIDDTKPWPWPPAANDATLVISDQQLDRVLGTVASVMEQG